MVCTLRPPGVSSARANSRRARARRRASGGLPSARAMASSSAASSSVVQRAERVEHALRHIGGGGLGEGDAEDFLRLDAGEQKIDHALRQHVGLARAGIGGDPGRHVRVGGLALQAPHVGRNGAGDLIAPLPRCRPPAAGGRPFLDAREMIVVAVVRRPHRMDERAIGLVVVVEPPRQRRELFQRAVGLAVRRALLEIDRLGFAGAARRL